MKKVWLSIKAFFKMFDFRFWLFAGLFFVYFFSEAIPSFPVGIKAVVIVGGILYVGLTIFTKVSGETIKWPWK